jgi:peptidoglycan LD-endopeptidase LytH
MHIRMLAGATTLLWLAQASSPADDYERLRRMHLVLPIDGLRAADIRDSFNDARSGGKPHGATDLPAPRGTAVRAMTDGFIRKLFLSKPGGNTIYEFDESQTYCFYYAHLDRYAPGLKEGITVRRGDAIGYVGSSGDASALAPHLHLEITRLDAEKHWWLGTGINPYPILRDLQRE